jgi:hypothetical protein
MLDSGVGAFLGAAVGLIVQSHLALSLLRHRKPGHGPA